MVRFVSAIPNGTVTAPLNITLPYLENAKEAAGA